ncbi:MAG TPA: hypothetical protein VHC22_33775 [Pirellulales bacterium]|nr:hypothetical protein [Pirellulales bacterium]
MTTTAIKRFCLEWLAIGLASATVGLLGLWVASLLSAQVGFVLAEDHLRAGETEERQISLNAGAFMVSKKIDTLEECDRWLLSTMYLVGQPLSLDLPGLAIRRVTFVDREKRWAFRFSLLLPAFVCAALTSISFWFYRRAHRKWWAELTKQ